MRTSELASRVGVNTETLRYYERRGLLAEPSRTSGGYRDYPLTAVGLVRFIKRAQELGFSFDEVEELLHLDAGGPDSCEMARALAERRIVDLAARIGDLQRMRDSLADLVATCDQPRADRRCELLEAMDHHPTVAR
jgi:Hg(II)-responsive transcriptional regulator